MRNFRSRALTSIPLALVCLGLFLLASAERRLWEADLNRPDVLGVKNAETGKVVNFFVEIDLTAGPQLAQVGPAEEPPRPVFRPALVLGSVVDHPESRAPPR